MPSYLQTWLDTMYCVRACDDVWRQGKRQFGPGCQRLFAPEIVVTGDPLVLCPNRKANFFPRLTISFHLCIRASESIWHTWLFMAFPPLC
jgi:hypothetical protein